MIADRDNGGDRVKLLTIEEREAQDESGRAMLDVIRERYMTDANRCIYAVGTQTQHDEFELRCELEDMGHPCLKDLGDDCEMYQSEGE